jgi:hypothetical protein
MGRTNAAVLVVRSHERLVVLQDKRESARGCTPRVHHSTSHFKSTHFLRVRQLYNLSPGHLEVASGFESEYGALQDMPMWITRGGSLTVACALIDQNL